MENIFENAVFGENFVSKDGISNSFCSFTKSGSDTLARLYREHWGVVIFYLDGQVHSGGKKEFAIIGRKQINEEELDRIAVGSTPIELIPHYDVKDGKSLLKLLRECFKAGYRKAKARYE